MEKDSPERSIQTEGGAYIEGGVKTQADFVAGNKTVIHQYAPLDETTRSLQRYRADLIARMRNSWIKGVLEKSLDKSACLDLTLQSQPNPAAPPKDPGERMVAFPGKQAVLLPPEKPLGVVFDEADHALLILGAPGSGKTITLLQLGRELMDQAEQDLQRPIPVVLKLTSWGEQRLPLEEWLILELNRKHKVPQELSRAWLEKDQLVLLLDSLDEVNTDYRRECVAEINAFRLRRGFTWIAVCSRTEAYSNLDTWLELGWVVLLQPLTASQITAYLQRAGPKMEALLAAIQHDPALKELAERPLLLSLLPVVYQELNEAPAAGPSVESMESRLKALFDRYVDRMFQERGLRRSEDRPQAIGWLAWLARQISLRREGEFMLEALQPNWLPSPQLQRAYRLATALFVTIPMLGIAWLVVQLAVSVFYGSHPHPFIVQYYRFVSGPVFAIGSAVVTWLAVNRRFGRWPTLAVGLSAALTIGLAILPPILYRLDRITGNPVFTTPERGLVVLLAGILSGMAFGMFYRWFGRRQTAQQIATRLEIEPVAFKEFGWKKALLGLLFGIAFGWLVAFTFQITVVLSWGAPLSQFLRFQEYFPEWWGLIGYAMIGLCAVLFAVVMGVLGGKIKIETEARPNRGTWLSGKNGLLVGGLLFASISAQALVLASTKSLLWAAAALLFGLGVGLFFGGYAFLQHFVLRFFLWRSRCMPWNYAGFLDEAVNLAFLRKVGYGYIFIHQLMQEYFRDL